MRHRRSRPWLATLLVLSACEPVEPLAPVGFDAPEARARGRELFLRYCAICHGEHADGQGPRRGSLTPPPASFRDPSWQQRTTPGRVHRVVREGVRGTPMPPWKAVLDEQQTWDVVAFLLGVGREGEGSAP
jgi:mono/diheme cytochrome c family protein